MTGKGSKSKGTRVEYLVRDYFRSLGEGWHADRVPASGAAQGFPGDVRVVKPDGSSFLVEVKARRDLFNSIYDEVAILGSTRTAFQGFIPTATLSYSYIDLFEPSSTIVFSAKFTHKVNKMQEFLKGSDILVIKGNNKPLLFIRYGTV